MEDKGIPVTINKVWAVYFSPTGGTKNIVRLFAGCLCEDLRICPEADLQPAMSSTQTPEADLQPFEEIDLTSPEAREREYRFGPGDLVVAGSPVYAGRIPNKIMPDWKSCLSAEGAVAVPIVVFGNRSFGGALTELRVILQDAGFKIAGGAALVSRHAFSDKVGAGRPDGTDEEEIRAFADAIAEKLKNFPKFLNSVSEEDIPPYYTPLKEDGTPAKFLKAKPETDPDKCDLCGICRDSCPVGSINAEMQTDGVCIKCQACVRKCPKHAKYFTDEDFLSHVRMLERDYCGRSANTFVIPD